MRLCWPRVCWQPLLLAQLDAVSWGALVSELWWITLSLPASSESLTAALGE